MYIQAAEGGEAWLQSGGVAYDKYTLSASQNRRYKITTKSSTAWGAVAPLGQNTLRYPQEEVGEQITSYIRVGDVPTTRLPETLSTTIPQGHTISGDWDDTLHLFERDGQLDFEGYGYIRTLEIKVKV